MTVKVPLPQQEVILPVTGRHIIVMPLTLKHKMMIAESEILTLSERYNFICKLLFDRIANKEIFGEDTNNINKLYQTFLSNIYEADLEALIYGIAQVTYRKPYTFRVVCPKCGQLTTVEVPMSDLIMDLKINQGGQDTFFNDIHTLDLPHLGLKFQLILPTLYHTIHTLKFAESKNVNLLAESVKSDNLESLLYRAAPYITLASIHTIQTQDGTIYRNTVTNFKAMEQILDILLQLTDEDLAELLTFTENLKSRYYIRLGFKFICSNPNCENHKNKVSIEHTVDLLTEFFPIPIERLLSG
jgi:hypothetical protein